VKSSSGTCFFVSQSGHIATNQHVVDSCSTITVQTDEMKSERAQLVARDTTNDLALLKVSLNAPRVATLKIGVKLGESVAAFGFPLSSLLASSGNFTLGNVTALAGLSDDTRHLQTSAPIQPGNSGGPLLDYNGNLVGVITSKLNWRKAVQNDGDMPQNVNFAVKSSILASFLESNRVTPIIGTSTTAKSAVDLAEHAKALTVFIRCD
jgi:serine protease Do